MDMKATMTPEQLSAQLTNDLFKQLGFEMVTLRAELMRITLTNQMLTAQVQELTQELAVFREGVQPNGGTEPLPPKTLASDEARKPKH